MKMTKINGVNYQIYTDTKNKQVIAVCRYAGHNVKGVAKCAPGDEFDISFGTSLAVARCEAKVAKKKVRNAATKYMEAAKEADKAQRKFDKMKQYYIDSVDQYDKALEDLKDILK